MNILALLATLSLPCSPTQPPLSSTILRTVNGATVTDTRIIALCITPGVVYVVPDRIFFDVF